LKEKKQGKASNIVSLSGPVIFQNSIVPKTLNECNEPLSVDQIRFGDLTTDKITQNVQIVNIGQNFSKFALIPKKPNGVYFYWALTHQNQVFADNVCESPHTRYADDPSVFKLAHQTYVDVVKAAVIAAVITVVVAWDYLCLDSTTPRGMYTAAAAAFGIIVVAWHRFWPDSAAAVTAAAASVVIVILVTAAAAAAAVQAWLFGSASRLTKVGLFARNI
jgi:hypothetical protein